MYKVFIIILLLASCSKKNSDDLKDEQDKGLLEFSRLQGSSPSFYTDLFRTIGSKLCDSSRMGANFFNCHNILNPPAPSITRSLSSDVKVRDEVIPATGYRYQTNEGSIMPNNAFTNDRRIFVKRSTYHKLKYFPGDSINQVHLFRPEKLLPHNRVFKGAPEKDRLTVHTSLHPIMYWDPRPGKTFLDYDRDNADWHTYHQTMCQKGANITSRKCSAGNGPKPVTPNPGGGAVVSSVPEVNVVEATCYDVTIISRIGDNNSRGYELRSSDLTLVVEDMHGDNPVIHPFPQSNQDYYNLNLIKDFANWEASPGVGDLASLVNLCDGQSPPFYCQYLDGQNFLSGQIIYKKYALAAPGEDPYHHLHSNLNNPPDVNWFEPTVTADGKLMFANISDSVYYSKSDRACDMTGFNVWEPLSKITTDPRTSHYDIAKYPLRDFYGNPIPAGARIPGAYLWIDHLGRNLVYTPGLGGRDHIFTRGEKSLSAPLRGDIETLLDPTAGKFISIVGSWTKGKQIVLDSGNYSDFANDERTKRFLDLYSADNLDDRLIGNLNHSSSFIHSFENFFFHYNELSPQSAFDVVWNAHSNNGRNFEIIFDEYLMNQALIVAHMNAPMKEVSRGNHDFHMFPDDGFAPDVPDNIYLVRDFKNEKSNGDDAHPYFNLKTSPSLQNASTSTQDLLGGTTPPSRLTLYGGARVEPVGAGGIKGKGVFLDGRNDFILAPMTNATQNEDWYYSIWLDPRESSATDSVLFYWGDGSFVSFNHHYLRFHYQSLGGNFTNAYMQLPRNYIKNNEFVNIGLKIEKIVGSTPAQTRIELILNGDSARTLLLNGVLSFNFTRAVSQQAGFPGGDYAKNYHFSVGAPNYAHMGPSNLGDTQNFRGWVDELKVYRLDSSLKDKNFFSEYACNLAYGTKVKVNPSDSASFGPLRRLYEKGKLFGKFVPLETPSPESPQPFALEEKPEFICEQMVIKSYDGVNEYGAFSDIEDQRLCWGNTHRNSNSSRCIRNSLLKHELAKAGSPRPDMSQNKFCLSCHNDQETIPQLTTGALVSAGIPREVDPRRLPMDHPVTVQDCNKIYAPFKENQSLCDRPEGALLDYIFDFNDKVTPKIRDLGYH